MSQSRLSIIPSRAVADEELTATQLRVLLAIGSYTGKDQSAYPKQSTIAEAIGIARETVNRAIKALAKRGYIEVHEQRRSDGGQAANLYVVKLDPCDATITPPVTPSVTPPVTPAITHIRTIHINDTNTDVFVDARETEPPPKAKKRKAAPRGKARARRIADNWTPTPKDIAFATSKGLTPEEISHEADRFRDYWTAASGAKARKCDWEATWRNWITSDFGPVARKAKQSKRTPTSGGMEAALRAADDEIRAATQPGWAGQELHPQSPPAYDPVGSGQAELLDADGRVVGGW